MPHDLSQAYHRSSSFDIRSTLCEAEYILSFLNRMMTGHKKWVVYEHSKSETLAFSRRKLFNYNKNGASLRSSLLWSDCKRVFHFDFLPNNATMNDQIFYQQLQHMNADLKKKIGLH